MPIDMSGSAAAWANTNAMNAQLGQQRRAQIVGGASTAVDAWGEMEAKNRVKEGLIKAGYSPEEAESISRAGPAAAATAILSRQRDQLQMKRDELERKFQQDQQGRGFTHAEKMDANQATRQGFVGGVYNPENDPSVVGGRVLDKERETRATDRDKALGKEIGGLLAPVQGYYGTSSPATRQTVAERAASGNYMASALGGADRFLPEGPKPIDPLDADIKRATAERMRAETHGTGGFAPTPAAPRNIDPLSSEGIAAFVKRWEQTEGSKTPSTPAGKEPIPDWMADQIGVPRGTTNQAVQAWNDYLKATEMERIIAKSKGQTTGTTPPVAPARPAAPPHPSGLPADKVQKLEAAGYRWNGKGWDPPQGTPR